MNRPAYEYMIRSCSSDAANKLHCKYFASVDEAEAAICEVAGDVVFNRYDGMIGTDSRAYATAEDAERDAEGDAPHLAFATVECVPWEPPGMAFTGEP